MGRYYRCEECLKKFPSNKMQTFRDKHVCIATCLRVVSYARCERCWGKFHMDNMIELKEEHICKECHSPTKKWFALTTFISETKAAKNLKRKFRDKGMSTQVGRILIPKQEEVRFTLNRYDVYDMSDKVIGQVSAEDQDEALHKAKSQFGKSRKRTLYRPEIHDDTLDKIEKQKAGRRVYYVAISSTGRVMGRGTGYKSLKAATEALTRLYGNKFQKSNPRETSIQPTDISRVELAKVGDKMVVQNKRSMNGYMLIEMYNTEENFAEIKSTPGIATLLPHPDKVPFEKYGRLIVDGEKTLVDSVTCYENIPPDPAIVSEEQVNKLIAEKPKEIVEPCNVSPEDKVRIKSGAFESLDAKVISVDKQTNIVTLEVTIIGRPVKCQIPCSELKR